METIKQAIKYGVVGLSNTLITMIVIWVMMKLFGCREGLSNLTGYVAGILNSFIWNKQWTFKGSSTGWTKGAVRFTIAFIIVMLTVRIGTDLEFPTYDRSLLQPLDWNGFLYGD